jgi:L-threonylcarbamoyladenylate synthase
VTEVVRIEPGHADVARRALERCVAGGGVAVFPADGLYGLACDPLNSQAIGKIHRLKGRDDGKPSAVMYFSPLAIRELLAGFGPRTKAAASALMPGPVTLVVANPERRYPLACRDDPAKLGVRLIGGALAGVMCPVFQTSANFSGRNAAAHFDQVPAEIVAGADLAIDGGELPGLPSTVIDVSAIDVDGSWHVIRPGAVSAGDLASSLHSVGLD